MQIIPRYLRHRKMKKGGTGQTIQKEQFEPAQVFRKEFEPSSQSPTHIPPKETKPQTKDMLVLGELYRGARTFETIKNNTGFNDADLESILDELESQGLMRVEQKRGIMGSKVELYATEKGFKKYLS